MMNNFTLGMEDRAEKLNNLLLAQEEDFMLEYVQAWKNNMVLEGYALRSDLKNCSPTIYYHEDWYNQEDIEVISYLKEMYEKDSCQIDISHLTDREYILLNIFPRLVSESNIEGLENKGIVHIKFLDMYILFYIRVNDFEDKIAFIQVTERILEDAGISINIAYTKSLENIEKELEIKSIQEILSNGFGIDISEFGEPQIPILVCTTKKHIQGAAVMLCDSVLRLLEEKIGERFAILPSSIHECLAVPYTTEDEFEMFMNMVKDINKTQVPIEEKLTDSVYYVQNGKLRVAM